MDAIFVEHELIGANGIILHDRVVLLFPTIFLQVNFLDVFSGFVEIVNKLIRRQLVVFDEQFVQ